MGLRPRRRGNASTPLPEKVREVASVPPCRPKCNFALCFAILPRPKTTLPSCARFWRDQKQHCRLVWNFGTTKCSIAVLCAFLGRSNAALPSCARFCRDQKHISPLVCDFGAIKSNNALFFAILPLPNATMRFVGYLKRAKAQKELSFSNLRRRGIFREGNKTGCSRRSMVGNGAENVIYRYLSGVKTSGKGGHEQQKNCH